MKGRTYISEPYKGKLGDFVFTASVPIYDNNKKVIGVLVADYDGIALNKYIKDIVVGETGFCYIIGKTGSAIAHPEQKHIERTKQCHRAKQKG